MNEAIIAYLQKKGAPATAQELAHAALHMANAPKEAASTLIQSLLQGVTCVRKVAEDSWIYVSPSSMEEMPLGQQPFLLCKIQPSQVASWQQWQQVAFAEVRNFRLVWQRFFILNTTTAWNRLISFVKKIGDHYSQHILVLDGVGNQLSLLRRVIYESTGQPWDGPVLTVKRILDYLQSQSPKGEQQPTAAIASSDLEEYNIQTHLRFLVDQFIACLQELNLRQILSLEKLLDELYGQKEEIDFSPYAFDRAFLDALPRTAGVYIMLDASGGPLYVGKSKNIHQRLHDYFGPMEEEDEKLAAIRQRLHSLRFILTGSELEALLLEAELIQALNPPINRQLQIALRSHRQRSRYPRILILPTAKEEIVLAVFLHPDRGLHKLPLSDAATTKDQYLYPELTQLLPSGAMHLRCYSRQEALAAIERFYFAPQQTPSLDGDTHLAEIAYSWLADNEQNINSIDLRKITSPEECLRLLFDYIHHILKSTDKVIYR